MTELRIDAPNEKQRRFLLDRHRHIAYGGARGGGKSWAVRTKAKLLALRYAGIKLLIVRRTLRELQNNHIDPLRRELAGIAKYKAADKRFEFPNGSTLTFGYCACDGDMGQYQGAEYDVVFLDEPLRGLDEGSSRATMAWLLPRLAGKTVFWVTHSEAEAAALLAPVLWTVDGGRVRPGCM